MSGMCERRPCPKSVRLRTVPFSHADWSHCWEFSTHTHWFNNHPSLHVLGSHHVVKDTTFIFPCVAFTCVRACVVVSINSCPHTHLICEIFNVFKYRHRSRRGCGPSLTPGLSLVMPCVCLAMSFFGGNFGHAVWEKKESYLSLVRRFSNQDSVHVSMMQNQNDYNIIYLRTLKCKTGIC